MGRHSFRATPHYIKKFEQEVAIFTWMNEQPQRAFATDELVKVINEACGTKRPHGIIRQLVTQEYVKDITLPGPRAGLALTKQGRLFAEGAPAELSRRQAVAEPEATSVLPPVVMVSFIASFNIRAVDDAGARAALVEYITSGKPILLVPSNEVLTDEV